MITPVKTIPIDVIVPIYRGLAETRRCLESVLNNAQRTPFELVAINDASPEPALSEWLEQLAAEGRLTLLTNERNLGFVLTVNRGMSLHPGRDLVLLNSDTEVANDWLDRLVATAQHNPSAGTLTPFSNNATICSYPFEGWNGGVPGTLGLAGLDRLIAETLPGRTIEIPTGVGFCMYIRRTCLDQVGLFDAERFGRGYGEENDFCRRAAAQGWQNLLAADVFVFHEGGVSFSAERATLQENAMKRLLEAHPDYLDMIRAFIGRDPIAPLRQMIDRARCACGGAEEAEVRSQDNDSASTAASRPQPTPPRPVQLHISHSWGGGTDRWIADYCSTDTKRRNLLLRSVSHRNAAGFRLELVEPAVDNLSLLTWDLQLPIRASTPSHPEYARILDEVMTDFHVGSLVVSSLIGHSLEALCSGQPTIVVLHDLYPFCPALFAHFDSTCTDCQPERLAGCLRTNSLNVFWHNTVDMDWHSLRREYAAHIAHPSVQVVAPSHSIHQRWAALQPGLADKPWTRIEHGLDPQQFPAGSAPSTRPDSHRPRILIPGRLAPHKGLGLLREALPALLDKADILLLGSGDFGRPFKGRAGVEVIENYAHHELAEIVRNFAPDCALLVSVLPESFSYTLSEMFALGIPVVATRVGAFAERITDGITGVLVEPQAKALATALEQLFSMPAQLATMRRTLQSHPPRSNKTMVADYEALLPAPTTNPADQTVARRIDSLRRRAEEDRHVHHAMTNLQETVRSQHQTIHSQQEWIANLEDRNHHSETRLQELLASNSWRLSAPLRSLSLAIRKRPANPPPPPAAFIHAPHGPSLPQLDAAGRHEIRERVRHWFGIPDQGLIVLSIGTPPDKAVSARYIQLIRSITSARNDICAILAGSTTDATCWDSVQEEMSTLVATRQLFFAESLHDREAFLLSADAFLAYDEASLRQNGEAAIDAGLFILSPADAATTADYLPVEQSHHVTPDTHDSACAALLAWLDMAPSRRTRIVVRSRQALDDTQQSPAKPTP